MQKPQYTAVTTPRPMVPDFLESAEDDSAILKIGDDPRWFILDRAMPSIRNGDGTWTTTLTWYEPTES